MLPLQTSLQGPGSGLPGGSGPPGAELRMREKQMEQHSSSGPCVSTAITFQQLRARLRELVAAV